MQRILHWQWFALLGWLLWLGEYSQRMGAEPMIGEFLWFSPTVKETIFTLLYYFSTIGAAALVMAFIVFVVIRAIVSFKQKMRKGNGITKPDSAQSLESLIKTAHQNLEDIEVRLASMKKKQEHEIKADREARSK